MNRHSHAAKCAKGSGYLKYSMPVESYPLRLSPRVLSKESLVHNNEFHGHRREYSGAAAAKGIDAFQPLEPPLLRLPKIKSAQSATTHVSKVVNKVQYPGSKFQPPPPPPSSPPSSQDQDQDFKLFQDQFKRLATLDFDNDNDNEYKYDSIMPRTSANANTTNTNTWKKISKPNYSSKLYEYDMMRNGDDDFSLGQVFLNESIQSGSRKEGRLPIFPTPPGNYLKINPVASASASAARSKIMNKNKSRTKVEYLPDYQNVRSQLLNLVEKEKKRRPIPRSAMTPSSSGIFKPNSYPLVASSSLSTTATTTSSTSTAGFNNIMNRTSSKSSMMNMNRGGGKFQLLNEAEAARPKKSNDQLDQLSTLFRKNIKATTANPADVINIPKTFTRNKEWSKLLGPESMNRDISYLFVSDQSDDDDGKNNEGHGQDYQSDSSSSGNNNTHMTSSDAYTQY